MTDVAAAVLTLLGELHVEARRHDGGVVLGGAQVPWLADALPTLGVRITVTGDELSAPLGEGEARCLHAFATALRPQALLFDLDGVLADIHRGTALATAAQLAALAIRLPLGVVTTCPRRFAASVLERHGFLPHVGTVVGYDDAPPKPDPAPVLLALRRLGAVRGWFVGDNPSDVTAARRARVLPVAIAPRGIGAESHAQRLREAGAARLLSGLDDVVDLLK